jgi:hypothetical protein
VSKAIGTAIVALLLLGSVSDDRVVSSKSAHHRHRHALSVGGTTPGVFDGHEYTALPMPNGGFECDPDFGPNGYIPCNAAGQ